MEAGISSSSRCFLKITHTYANIILKSRAFTPDAILQKQTKVISCYQCLGSICLAKALLGLHEIILPWTWFWFLVAKTQRSGNSKPKSRLSAVSKHEDALAKPGPYPNMAALLRHTWLLLLGHVLFELPLLLSPRIWKWPWDDHNGAFVFPIVKLDRK